MKTAKWIIGFFAATAICYFILLETGIFSKPKTQTENINPSQKPTIKKRYTDDGTIKSDVTIVNGVRHGVAHNYYPDGSIHSKIFYKNGKKDSLSTWFYEDGSIYRTTAYNNGVKHGYQKKYYRNGTLMAEIPYINNELQPGTKEYSESGKPIKPDFEFNYSIDNSTITQQKVFLKVSGKHVDDIYKHHAFYTDDPSFKIINFERSAKNISYYITSKKDSVSTKKISIWLYTKTRMNNHIIIEKTLTVKIGQI